jgi:uncharacterized cupin superfamily protein
MIVQGEDELVYLLEGEIEVTLGNQKMKAVPGVMSLLPRGIPHGFTNIGNKPSRLLDTILPGQFDNYFVELAAHPKSKLMDSPKNTGSNICKVISKPRFCVAGEGKSQSVASWRERRQLTND